MFPRTLILSLLAVFCIGWAMATTTHRPRILGGFSDVEDLNDADVQDSINLGGNHIAAQPGHPCRAGLNVQRVQVQVVSGIKHRVTFRSNPALCENGPQTAKICTVDVVRKPWLQEVTVHRHHCRDA